MPSVVVILTRRMRGRGKNCSTLAIFTGAAPNTPRRPAVQWTTSPALGWWRTVGRQAARSPLYTDARARATSRGTAWGVGSAGTSADVAGVLSKWTGQGVWGRLNPRIGT